MKKLITKVVAMTTVAAMALTTAGCGRSDNSTESSANGGETENVIVSTENNAAEKSENNEVTEITFVMFFKANSKRIPFCGIASITSATFIFTNRFTHNKL